MDKKSVSATILVLFIALFFSVVGSCFYYFVYEQSRVLVTKVGLIGDNGITFFHDEKLSKSANKLKLSKMDLGLKPATGEIDAETQIPSTITDQGTSEGYYATIFVKAVGNFRIQISNINIDSDHDELLIDEERKNIFVGVKDLKNSVKTLDENGVEICRYSNATEPVKITFLIWLGSLSSAELEGAKISFDLKFVSL